MVVLAGQGVHDAAGLLLMLMLLLYVPRGQSASVLVSPARNVPGNGVQLVEPTDGVTVRGMHGWHTLLSVGDAVYVPVWQGVQVVLDTLEAAWRWANVPAAHCFQVRFSFFGCC